MSTCSRQLLSRRAKEGPAEGTPASKGCVLAVGCEFLWWAEESAFLEVDDQGLAGPLYQKQVAKGWLARTCRGSFSRRRGQHPRRRHHTRRGGSRRQMRGQRRRWLPPPPSRESAVQRWAGAWRWGWRRRSLREGGSRKGKPVGTRAAGTRHSNVAAGRADAGAQHWKEYQDPSETRPHTVLFLLREERGPPEMERRRAVRAEVPPGVPGQLGAWARPGPAALEALPARVPMGDRPAGGPTMPSREWEEVASAAAALTG